MNTLRMTSRKANHNTFGGIILETDFYTDHPSKHKVAGSFIASRIASITFAN